MHENYGQTSPDHVNEAIHSEEELYRHFANMTMQNSLTFETLEDVPDIRYSQRSDADERREDQTIQSLQADPDFYTQAMSDEETADAVRMFARIYRQMENTKNDLAGNVIALRNCDPIVL